MSVFAAPGIRIKLEVAVEDRLNRMALKIVERVVEKEDFVGVDPEGGELSTELLEGVRAEATGDEGADVFGAEIGFDGTPRVQGKSEVADGSEVMANGAAVRLDRFDDRVRVSEGEKFEAIGAIGFRGDPIPGARVVAAAGASEGRLDDFGRRESQLVHEKALPYFWRPAKAHT